MKSVIIDPGHGGSSNGAVNLAHDFKEKDLALTLGYLLVPVLQELGLKPWLTRTEDKNVSLQERVQFANHIGADLFVSLHFNAAPGDIGRGFEAFYAHQSKRGKLWAECCVAELEDAFPDAVNRGAKPDNASQHSSLYVLQNTWAPAILVEPSFISNTEGLLWALRNMLGIAQAIGNSILRYYERVER